MPVTGKKSAYLQFATLLFGLGLLPAGTVFGQATLPNTTADFVWGQGGNFTTNIPNKGGVTNASLLSPVYMAFDRDGSLYITDRDNHRVLHYPKGSNIADFVYGQNGSFLTNAANKGGLTETSLNTPGGVVPDGAGGLYIADAGNNRVLHYPKGSANADFVYGQNGAFNTGTVNKGGLSAVSLNVPDGLALDNNGGLYVADHVNNRVLHYPQGSNIPDNVWGQGGSFTTGTANNGGITDSSLSAPCCLAFDGAGGFYVAEIGNHRVLHFPPGSRSADRVYGQGANQFTTGVSNKGGISRNGLSSPEGLAVDTAGGLYIGDSGNNRILHYPQGSVTADAVYGQGGDFTTNLPNKSGQVDADGLNGACCVAVDDAGSLYVGDTANNRVLKYNAPVPPTPTISTTTATPSTPAAGQTFTFTISGTNFDPATVQVEFTGPNCTPCVVTNAQLTSKSATSVSGSITLATAGTYTIVARNGAGNAPSASSSLTVTGGTTTGTGGLGLAHIADSQGWITSIILLNSDTVPASFSVQFYGSQLTGRSVGVPMSLAFAGLPGRTSLVQGTIPVGGSRIIQTAGTDTQLNAGWAQLTTSNKVTGFGVFRDTVNRQEASVDLTQGQKAFLLPFDNTQGRATTYAIVNTNPTATVTVTLRVRDQDGNTLNTTSFTLTPLAQTTGDTSSGNPNQQGVIEFRTSNADISGLGFRFDAAVTGSPRAFSSFPAQPIN